MKIVKEKYEEEIRIDDCHCEIVEKERDIKLYELNECSKADIEYITKHLNKAQDILRKASMRYMRREFVDSDDIDVRVYNSYNALACVGRCRTEKKDYYININKSFLFAKYKRKYDKEFLETLMHELIHIYCMEWFTRDKNFDWSADSSFVFCTIVSWFNKNLNNKYKISLNNNLEYGYGLYHKQLLEKINDGFTFNLLRSKLYECVIRTENKLKNIQKEISVKRVSKNFGKMLLFEPDYKNNNSSYAEVYYYKVKDKDGNWVYLEKNTVYLGLDINILEDEEDWSIDGIMNYILDNEAEENRYFMNCMEDAEILELPKVS